MGRLFAENKSQGAYQQEHKNKLVRGLLCVAQDLCVPVREHKNKELCVVFFLGCDNAYVFSKDPYTTFALKKVASVSYGTFLTSYEAGCMTSSTGMSESTVTEMEISVASNFLFI
jgi:hypothetical protein